MSYDKQILASRFNRRITLKRAVPYKDSSGGSGTDSFTTLFTTWASVESMRASRKVYLGIDEYTNAYDVQFRYAVGRDLKTSDLLDYINGTVIQTLSITNLQLITQGYKRFLVCVAQEVTVNA